MNKLVQTIKELQDAKKAMDASVQTQNDVVGGTDEQAIIDAATAVKDTTAVYNDCLAATISFDLTTVQPSGEATASTGN